MSKNDLIHVFARILRDVQIELKDEFDRNFERQGFFSERWARRRSPLRPGRATLVDTGGLRYFWARHYVAVGGFGRKKSGELRGDKRTRQLSSEASFWKYMALMRVGSVIRIPKRQFLGAAPEVEKAVTGIIEQNLEEYFNNEFKLKK